MPPPGDRIPSETSPFAIDDPIPSMDEIEWAVRHLRNYFLGGASIIRSEQLQYWMGATKHEELTDTANWDWVEEIIQKAFMDVRPPADRTWQTVVLIIKGNGKFRGIGIVDGLWKALLLGLSIGVPDVLM